MEQQLFEVVSHTAARKGTDRLTLVKFAGVKDSNEQIALMVPPHEAAEQYPCHSRWRLELVQSGAP